ncbi:hypothetical protein IRJ41_012982 [Triplophysa rosa]|uniref:Reverse transcriptase domain-containing protein n=1 Tax=Triplophysa rosa TaxID=992332 RepID=A0A9W7WEY3_TRIRA|nr:hypothetical protein IRJ41_012982 [Triplophysa rosa]
MHVCDDSKEISKDLEQLEDAACVITGLKTHKVVSRSTERRRSSRRLAEAIDCSVLVRQLEVRSFDKMEDHAYCAQEPTERESPSSKKRKRDAARRIRDKRRQKSRINIGVSITRWKALLKDKCFQGDAEVACFLLDCSAFNTIIPDLLLPKLTQLSVPTSTCQWIINFLSNRQQLVRLGKFKSSTCTISTGAPQGCVLSPLLYSLYTNECTSTDPSVKLLKFADDTTVIGLIQDGDESAYRKEVAQLAAWCSQNNLELNAFKTVEMIVDFRRNPPSLPPLTILDSTVDTVESFRFLGSTISQDLKWESHIDSIVKKAQQRLYFLRQLRKFNLPQELLTQFYSVVIESVLCTSITVWYGSATKSDLRRLQRTVRSAEKIIGAPLPTLQDLYDSTVKNRARKIIIDSTHPANKLFEPLPSGRFSLVILLSGVHGFMWSVSCYNSDSNGGSSGIALDAGPLMQDDVKRQIFNSWYGAKNVASNAINRNTPTNSSGTLITSGSNRSSESVLKPMLLVMGSPVVQQVVPVSGQSMTQSSSQIVLPIVQQLSLVAPQPNRQQIAQASSEAMTQASSQQLTQASYQSLTLSDNQQSHSQPSSQQPVHVVSGTIVQPSNQQSVLTSSQPNSPVLSRVSFQSVAKPIGQQTAQASYQSVQASAQQLPQAGYQSVAQAGGLVKPHRFEVSQIVSRLFPCTRPVQNESVGFFKPGMPNSESVVNPVSLNLQAFAQAPSEQLGQSSYQSVAEVSSQQSSQASGAPAVQASYQSVSEVSGQQPLQASYQSVVQTSGLSEAQHIGHHSAAQSNSQQIPYISYQSVSQVSGQQPVQGLYQSVAQSSSHHTAQRTDVQPVEASHESAEQSSSQQLQQTSYQSVNQSSSQQLAQASSLSVVQSSSQQPAQAGHLSVAHSSSQRPAKASYPSVVPSSSFQVAQASSLAMAQTDSQQLAPSSYSSVVQSSSQQPAQAAFESVSQPTGQKPALGRYPSIAKPVVQQPAEENVQPQGGELFQIGTKLYSCYEVVSQSGFDQYGLHSGQSRYPHPSRLSSPPSSQPAVQSRYQALVKPGPSSYGSALSPSHQVSASSLQSGFMPKPSQSNYELSAQQEQPSSLPFVRPGQPRCASTLLRTD